MTAQSSNGKEIVSPSLVSALMQVGWRLYLSTTYHPRGDGTTNAREVWLLVSPGRGDGIPTITRPIVMRTVERLRRGGRVVPSPDRADEWVLAQRKVRA